MNKKTLVLGQIFADRKNNTIFIMCAKVDLLEKARFKKVVFEVFCFSGSMYLVLVVMCKAMFLS